MSHDEYSLSRAFRLIRMSRDVGPSPTGSLAYIDATSISRYSSRVTTRGFVLWQWSAIATSITRSNESSLTPHGAQPARQAKPRIYAAQRLGRPGMPSGRRNPNWCVIERMQRVRANSVRNTGTAGHQ